MISAFCLGRGEGAGRKERGREIPHIRRATLSQERKRGKKSACSVRNDSPGGGERQCIAEGRSNAAPPKEKHQRAADSTTSRRGHDISCPYLDQGGTTPDMRA